MPEMPQSECSGFHIVLTSNIVIEMVLACQLPIGVLVAGARFLFIN